MIQIHHGSGDNVAGNKIILNEKPRRNIDNTLKDQLIRLLQVEATIDISYLVSDLESFNFAEQIKFFLEDSGYTVNRFSSATYSPPLTGQILEKVNNLNAFYILKIGSSN